MSELNITTQCDAMQCTTQDYSLHTTYYILQIKDSSLTHPGTVPNTFALDAGDSAANHTDEGSPLTS